MVCGPIKYLLSNLQVKVNTRTYHQIIIEINSRHLYFKSDSINKMRKREKRKERKRDVYIPSPVVVVVVVVKQNKHQS